MPTQKDSNFAVALQGLTIESITGCEVGSSEVIIITTEGITSNYKRRKFKLYHEQNCCENVAIEMIKGNLSQCLGEVIEKATEHIVNNYPNGESATKTIFGIKFNYYESIAMEWLGTSNGYYSESVSFVEVFE